MYAQLKFKNVEIHRNTQFSKLSYDKRLGINALTRVFSFFDDDEKIVYYDYKRDELISVIIPDHKTEYVDRLFDECENLEFVKLSENSKMISDDMFCGCKKLKNIELPDGITNIGRHAFNGCESIETISLPYNLEHIDFMAFGNCKNLKQIRFRNYTFDNKLEFNLRMTIEGYADESCNFYIWD